jgi:hypothetical protein
MEMRGFSVGSAPRLYSEDSGLAEWRGEERRGEEWSGVEYNKLK